MNSSGEIYQTFDAVKELMNLCENHILSIPKIEWWLLKYSDLYKKSNPETLEIVDTLDFDLADRKYTPEEKFGNAYEELEILCNYYRAEQVLAEKVLEQSLIQGIDFMQEDWQVQNEIYFQEHYSCFMLDYMDYDDDPIYLRIFLHTLPKVEIFVEREYFKNTLDYIGIMNG